MVKYMGYGVYGLLFLNGYCICLNNFIDKNVKI